jgi:uncharacterized protein YbaA (DUF1428 family)
MTKDIETAKPHKQTKHSTMAHYIDGFVIPFPKNKIDDYRRIAQKAGEVWRDHGASEYQECVGEDLDVKGQVPFPRLINSTPDETVVLAWIVFKSREHRDEVNEGSSPSITLLSRIINLLWECRVAIGTASGRSQ